MKFLMDKTAVKLLVSRGSDENDARDYVIVGCMEPFVPGKDNIIIDGQVNVAKCLELALHDGMDPVSGLQFGPHTGKVSDLKVLTTCSRPIKNRWPKR
jgi:formate C-acetyltransferase